MAERATSSLSDVAPRHLVVVALETFFCPAPEPLDLPPGYTYELRSYARTRPDEVAERIRDADIVTATIVPLSAEVLDEAVTPRLRMIGVVASGTDNVDLAACRRRGIHVANTPNCNQTAVAQHVIALYFAARRSVPLVHQLTRAGEWPRRGSLIKVLDGPDGKPPRTARDEVMGIVGYGSVGRELAATARALGMRVVVSGRKGAAAVPEGRVAFDDVLRQATVLVLCLPRSPETLNTISAAELRQMRPHAVLVNVSRGGIVDEKALVEALKARTIAGAATDVFFQEPATPENSPLLAPETADLNLVLTPHVAWCAEDTNENYQNALKENISSWLAGKPTNTVV